MVDSIAFLLYKQSVGRICRFIGTLFGVGYIPVAPGTAASVLFCVLYILVPAMQAHSHPYWLIPAIPICVWICDRAQKDFKQKDPPQIVLDEWVGMAMALWGVEKIGPIFAAFVFFRFFDVVKMPMIRRLEGLPGGWGIVADDLAAGCLANLVVRLAFGLGFRFF